MLKGFNKTSLHCGHRKRMLEKYNKLGPDCFEPHELLEMLLYYGIYCKNTNGIAHSLINGSEKRCLYGVLRKELQELVKTEGIGFKNAVLLRLSCDINRAALLQLMNKTPLDNDFKRRRYIMGWFWGKPRATAMVLILSKRLVPLDVVVLSQGKARRCVDHINEIAKRAQAKGAAFVIMAHNHRSNDPKPSDNDICITSNIRASLAAKGIGLLEHYIVTDYDCIPVLAHMAEVTAFNERNDGNEENEKKRKERKK